MHSVTRRNFLIAGFLTTTLAVIYSGKIFSYIKPADTLDVLQKDLFPQADAMGVDVVGYFSIVQNHSRISEEDKEFILNGIEWLNEEAVELYGRLYSELTYKKRTKVLESIAQVSWGDNFIYRMLSYIMEACFSDPLYGVNPKSAGQKWLHFENGVPHPKEPLL